MCCCVGGQLRKRPIHSLLHAERMPPAPYRRSSATFSTQNIMQSIASRSRCAQPVAGARQRTSHVPAPVVMRSSRRSCVRALAAFAPPPVADSKRKFYEAYRVPIPNIYNTVLQELLVQMHFIRYAVNYEYNEIYALGFVSVFDQIMEALPEGDRKAIFNAYVQALGEKPETFRQDAQALEQQASSLSGPEALSADAAGSTLQKALARVAERTNNGKFQYNKFFAIGLFRLLELTGAKEPAALERLVKSVGVKPENVNRDLLLYKGILSKLSAAKELMREFTEREKRKQAEREAEKAAKAEAEKKESAVQA